MWTARWISTEYSETDILDLHPCLHPHRDGCRAVRVGAGFDLAEHAVLGLDGQRLRRQGFLQVDLLAGVDPGAEPAAQYLDRPRCHGRNIGTTTDVMPRSKVANSKKPQIMALTWGFGGAACRTRTDDPLITKTTRGLSQRSDQRWQLNPALSTDSVNCADASADSTKDSRPLPLLQ